MNKEEYINEMAKCPCCGEIIDKYYTPFFDGGNIIIPWDCFKCNVNGWEIYEANFIGHKFEVDGEEIDLTEED